MKRFIQMERKDFIKKFAVGGSILLTAPVIFSSCSEDDDLVEPTNNDPSAGITINLTASAYSDLGEIGGYAYKDDIIIFRTADNTYLALSKKCTHQGCNVTYNHSDGNVPCPCHGSVFNTSGAVLNGPASTALKRYNVKKDGNTLTLT